MLLSPNSLTLLDHFTLQEKKDKCDWALCAVSDAEIQNVQCLLVNRTIWTQHHSYVRSPCQQHARLLLCSRSHVSCPPVWTQGSPLPSLTSTSTHPARSRTTGPCRWCWPAAWRCTPSPSTSRTAVWPSAAGCTQVLTRRPSLLRNQPTC